MLDTKRFLYVGFMCHQAIEKALKGIFVARKPETEPPYIHKLTRSVNQAIEPVLLTTADDRSGFLQTVQRTGIAV